MRIWKYSLVFILGLFGFVFVKANMSKNYKYKAPADFLAEPNYFPSFFPTTYNYTGAEKVTVLIPPEIRSKLGTPKTKSGELDKSFIQGKLNLNAQFGIENWQMENYRFATTAFGERLEIIGTYTSYSGIPTTFIEHHYFGKISVQSIHLFYPSQAEGKVVEQAKLSLQTFNPNVN